MDDVLNHQKKELGMHRLSIMVAIVSAFFVGCSGDTITDVQVRHAMVSENVPIRLVYHLGEYGMYAFMYSAYYSYSDEPAFTVWRNPSDSMEVIDTILNVPDVDFVIVYSHIQNDLTVMDSVEISVVADSVYHFGHKEE